MAIATGERAEALLEATCRVVARKGAHALRMSDVAREANVSNALLHYYFETRTELLARAFAFAEDRVEARVAAELATLPTAGQRLRRFLLLYVSDESIFHENSVLWNEVWSSALFDRELRPRIKGAYSGWVKRVIELVRDAVDEGSAASTTDVDAVAKRLAALVDGLGSQRLVALVTPAETARLVEEALDLELEFYES